MTDLRLYHHFLTLHSADWWDDPGGFYPAYYSREEVERSLPARAEADLRAAGAWPPPNEGITLLSSGVVKVGDARSEWVQPTYTLAFDFPGFPAGTKIKLGRKRDE